MRCIPLGLYACPLFPEIFSREILRESFARLKKPLSLQRNQGNEETFKKEIAPNMVW